MKKPIEVFLDTNVFDSQYYDFHNGKLLRLKQLVKEGKIVVLLSKVVVGESKRHIERNITDMQNALKKPFDKELAKLGYETKCTGQQAIKILGETNKYDFLYKMSDRSLKDEMIKDAIAQFDLFIFNIKARILDSSGVDINSIISDYFDKRPPFEERKDKKSEFPDAFIMAKIRMFAKQHSQSICVVSNDKAFKDLEKSPNIRVFSKLQDFFRFINPYEDWLERVKSYLDVPEQHDNICKMIKEKIQDINPYIDGENYDRKGIVDGFDYEETEISEVNDVTFKFESVDSVNNGDLTVTLDCKAKIYADCTYFDESDSVWDSEEKDYIFRNYGNTEETHVVEFEGILKLKVDDEKIVATNSIQFDFTLDQNTRISRTIIEDNPVANYLNSREFICPNCGKIIVVNNLADYMGCVNSEEREMGTENQYSFEDKYIDECPKCYHKFKIDGNVWEYPIGVINLDELKIQSAK